MDFATMKVESSIAQPLQDVDPLERAATPQVCKRDEFVKGEIRGTVRLSGQDIIGCVTGTIHIFSQGSTIVF